MGLTAGGIATAVKGSIIVSFSVSIFFSAALGYLLQMIGIIQIALHLPLLSVKFPSNALTFFSIILPIVNYDLLNDNKWYNDQIIDFSRQF
jgi:hypothetical protein